MNKFLLLKAKNKSLYDKARNRIKEQALQVLPYYPDRIRIREFKESLVIFCQFEVSDSGGFKKNYVSTRETHTFAFDGFPYSLDVNPEKNWAEQFDSLWGDDEKAISEIYGTWAFAKFDPIKGGKVLSDFTGMTPLFYWKDENYLAISPRQMLLSTVCGNKEIDIETLAWLSGQANIIGDKTPFKGVRHLPPQWTMSFSPNPGDLGFQFKKREIWTSSIDTTFNDDDIEQVAQTLLNQCEALSRINLPRLTLDITGGLDSRLVVALVEATSLKHKVDSLATNGQENSYEIQVGRSVAELLNIPHVSRIITPQSNSPEKILELLRYHAFHFDHSVCPPDGLQGAARQSRLIFTGSAGEIYRRNCQPHIKVVLKNKDELWNLFGDYHQKTDPLDIELPYVRDKQKLDMRELAMSLYEQGADMNDITDIFFMRYRMPLWNGPLLNNIYGGVRVYPLANYHVAKLAFSKGYQARVSDRIHFELLLKINPKLCAAPFLGFVWPKEFQKIASKKGIKLASKPYPVTGSRQWHICPLQ